MTSPRIPATLVTGATGAGKTTLISRFIAGRAAAERWAVLVNDFGEARLNAPDVVVREVAGCICCTAQVSLRTALVALLRESRPQRLVIEASSAAHPDAIARVLREPGLASSVELRRTVCVVDPRHVTDARYTRNEVYREQLRVADAVVVSKTDAVGADERDAALAALDSLGAAPVVDAAEIQNGFRPAPE